MDLDQLGKRLGCDFRLSGFQLFLVGGALRNELLATGVRELDFATDARPDQVASILDEIPAATVYRVGEKYGTIGVVWGDSRAEITTYRSGEKYQVGSRKPAVEFGRTLLEDLSRRDFTINAMARPVETNIGDADIVDPFGGRADLQRRLIRAVGDAHDRFKEDSLRLLRAVRFASMLSFEIEPQTWQAMKETAPTIQTISRERIADELNLMLTGLQPSHAMTLLRDSGLLEQAIPQLGELDRMPDHGPRHALSLWAHTMRVLAAVPADPITRWAALLHDIAKPETRSFDPDGRIRFYQHEDIGARRTVEILRSLRMSNDLTSSVCELVATHMQLHAYSEEWSDAAVRRLSQRLEPNFQRALDLAKADATGHGDTSWGISKIDALEERARRLREQAPEVKSPLNGNELMEHYGWEPGPWVGELKDALTEQVLEGRLRYDDKESAWKEADRIISSLER